MRKNLCLLLSIGLSLLLFSCSKDDDAPNLDKEVRLLFPLDNWATNKTQFEISPRYTHLIKFNKTNYSNIESITFYSSITNAIVGDTVQLELFNVTDNTPIANSSLQANTASLDYKLVQTSDILNDLPNKEIDLAIRLKSKKGDWVHITAPYLILRRN